MEMLKRGLSQNLYRQCQVVVGLHHRGPNLGNKGSLRISQGVLRYRLGCSPVPQTSLFFSSVNIPTEEGSNTVT